MPTTTAEFRASRTGLFDPVVAPIQRVKVGDTIHIKTARGADGWHRISDPDPRGRGAGIAATDSPLGAALLGAAVGDIVLVPGARRTLQIVDITARAVRS